jgi:hypothetical protein
MSAWSRPSLWIYFFSRFVCHDCGGERGYASRPRTFREKFILPLLRCGDCYQRSWRPISVALMRRDHELFANR